jgi:hypothetical protein
MSNLKTRVRKLEDGNRWHPGKSGYKEIIVKHPGMTENEVHRRISAAEEMGVPYVVVISHIPEALHLPVDIQANKEKEVH